MYPEGDRLVSSGRRVLPQEGCDAKHLVSLPNSIAEEQSDGTDHSRGSKELESFVCPLIHGVRNGLTPLVRRCAEAASDMQRGRDRAVACTSLVGQSNWCHTSPKVLAIDGHFASHRRNPTLHPAVSAASWEAAIGASSPSPEKLDTVRWV